MCSNSNSNLASGINIASSNLYIRSITGISSSNTCAIISTNCSNNTIFYSNSASIWIVLTCPYTGSTS